MKILQSATKIVFLLMALATITLTFRGIVDSKDFMILSAMVFNYYFIKNTSSTT